MQSFRYKLMVVLPSARPAKGPRIRTPADAAKLCKALVDFPQEVCLVLTLDQKYALIDQHLISLGSLGGSLVCPREVFRVALLDNAAAVMLVHCHPSGDPTPSKEDITLTKRLTEAGDMIGVRVLDHVIIGRGQYFSFVVDGPVE